MREIKICDLCGANSDRFRDLANEMPNSESVLYKLGVKKKYNTVVCEKCGWVFKPGVLNSGQLKKLYSIYGGESTINNGCDEQIKIRSNELFQWVGKKVDISEPKKIIDVGGGIGQVTSVFAKNRHKVTVIDMATQSINCKNIDLVRSDYYDFNEVNSYDIIFLNHIAEHVWDPTKLFNHSYDLLRKSGVIYIEVPFELITPLVKSNLGDTCHVGYFTVTTLSNFLKKSNFKILKIERNLGWYNDRRVMTIRAIGVKNKSRSTLGSFKVSDLKVTRLKLFFEIVNIKQIIILLKLFYSKFQQLK
jgi:SAM-dependent methyltransferase